MLKKLEFTICCQSYYGLFTFNMKSLELCAKALGNLKIFVSQWNLIFLSWQTSNSCWKHLETIHCASDCMISFYFVAKVVIISSFGKLQNSSPFWRQNSFVYFYREIVSFNIEIKLTIFSANLQFKWHTAKLGIIWTMRINGP